MGHCDEREPRNITWPWRQEARAALDYLVSLGIPAPDKTTSYGEELPLCKESTETASEKKKSPGSLCEARGRLHPNHFSPLSWRFDISGQTRSHSSRR